MLQKQLPDHIVNDFDSYAIKCGVPLTEACRKLIFEIESGAASEDVFVDSSRFLSVLIRDVPELQRSLIKHGLDPVFAGKVACEAAHEIADTSDTYSSFADDLYSSNDRRGLRSSIGMAAIAFARASNSSRLTPLHLILALFDTHDFQYPSQSNGDWTDEGLQVPFNTLSHLLGRKYNELWLSLDIIRRDIGLLLAGSMRKESIEAAPTHVRNGLLSFFADHPEYSRNCFLIMPFRESPPLLQIHKTLTSVMKRFGFNLLRADQYVYSENLFTNIEIFMHGSRFAVSVIERAVSDPQNPNVALEVGYMLGLKKDVCLLKEKTVPSLPSDLQGRLYLEFDIFNIEETVQAGVERWLKERGILIRDTDS